MFSESLVLNLNTQTLYFVSRNARTKVSIVAKQKHSPDLPYFGKFGTDIEENDYSFNVIEYIEIIEHVVKRITVRGKSDKKKDNLV